MPQKIKGKTTRPPPKSEQGNREIKMEITDDTLRHNLNLKSRQTQPENI
jgi:hypothetical protein